MTSQAKRLLVINHDPAANSALLRGLTGSRTLAVCGVATRMEEVWHLLQTCVPDLVLVGRIPGMETAFLCQQLRYYCPQVMCLAVCAPEDGRWESFLRELGVGVLQSPVSPEELERMACQISGEAAGHQAGSPGKIVRKEAEKRYGARKHFITVYGPKGGVGKTFLSRELAVHFAMQKREGRRLKVLAVDLNLDLGTIATSLNLPRTPNLYTWVQAIDRELAESFRRDGKDAAAATDAEWRDYSSSMCLSGGEAENYVVVHEETGLHVLTSPREIHHSFEIKDYHIYLMLESLKRSDYDVILIDTAPDTTDATIQALFFARRVVMVGTPVVDSIENIQRMLKLLREAEYPEERIDVCINRLQRREMFTLEEMRAYFHLHPNKTIYSIPDDDEVKRSINTGIPLMLYPGRQSVRDSITELADSLIATDAQPRSAAGKKQKKKPSFFLQLFQK